MKRVALYTGGVLNAVLAVFHGAFPAIFDWKHSLATLSSDNRATTYALANHTALVIAGFALVSFTCATDLRETRLGRIFSALIAAFYVLRIAEEWWLFDHPLGGALGLSLGCLLLVVIYGYAALGPRQHAQATATV